MPLGEKECGSYDDIEEASSFLVIPALSYCELDGAEQQSSTVGENRVASLSAGDWIAYDVNLPNSTYYRVQFQISSAAGEGAFQFENAFTKEIYTSIETVPHTGDADVYDSISRDVRLPEGSSTLLLRSIEPGWNLLSLSIEEIGEISKPSGEATGFVRAFGREILDGKGNILHFKGMGLGGWMVHEPYMMLADKLAKSPTEFLNLLRNHIGYTATASFRKQWLENYVTLKDVQKLKSLGFNLFQAPLHYDLFTLPVEQEPERGHDTWLLTGFDLLDQLVDWCTQEEIYLVIVLQVAPGGQGRASSANDYNVSKPSLWEDDENIRKTIALWREIARRYKDNAWVAGYDLLGAVDWIFQSNNTGDCKEDGNTPLKQFYVQAIEAIRQVDPNHMFVLNGNCGGTHHQGIFPISESNAALGFQHYWTDNTLESLQNYLEIRATTNIPLLMMQAGENHNKWYQEAAELFERNEIGWSFSPWKKIDATSSPFTVLGTSLYYALLDKWQNEKLDILNANQIMFDVADNAKLEKCTSNEAVTLAIMGVNTECDQSAPSYTITPDKSERIEAESFCRLQNAVIENTADELDTGGFNLGWLNKGVAASYKLNITVDGDYEIIYRVASIDGDGSFRIEKDGAIIGEIESIPATNEWQKWTDVSHVVQLSSGAQVLSIVSTQQGWNLNWFEIALLESLIDVPLEDPIIFESEISAKEGG
jgi:aryl-phospho-beta-D-glucosidase BglC (GH1 family)